MIPTEVITVLEKVLEAGPTPGNWQWVEPVHDQPQLPDDENFRLALRTVEQFPASFGGTLPKFILDAEEFGGETQEINAANAQWIAACSPLAIRTLLDAHASALRALQKIALIVIDRDEMIERGLAAVGYARSALDDNTKGE